jgi:hypothetical protein
LFLDKPGDYTGHFFGVGVVIFDNQIDLLAVYATVAINLVGGKLDGIQR